jgi:hypothetical protein
VYEAAGSAGAGNVTRGPASAGAPEAAETAEAEL